MALPLLEHFMPRDVVSFDADSLMYPGKPGVVISSSLQYDVAGTCLPTIKYQVAVPTGNRGECRLQDVFIGPSQSTKMSLRTRSADDAAFYDGSPTRLPIRLGCRVQIIGPEFSDIPIKNAAFTLAIVYLSDFGARSLTSLRLKADDVGRLASQSPLYGTLASSNFPTWSHRIDRLATLPSYYTAASAQRNRA